MCTSKPESGSFHREITTRRSSPNLVFVSSEQTQYFVLRSIQISSRYVLPGTKYSAVNISCMSVRTSVPGHHVGSWVHTYDMIDLLSGVIQVQDRRYFILFSCMEEKNRPVSYRIMFTTWYWLWYITLATSTSMCL